MKTVEYEIIDLPEIAIIGKEGLCTKENNVAQELWQQANSDLQHSVTGVFCFAVLIIKGRLIFRRKA